MFKIGDFSRLTQVSVKALRYYDAIDLLKPAQVDEWTGYRYYTAAQIDALNRILALKDLGLTLDQIRSLLREELPQSAIVAMLRHRQRELRDQLAEQQRQLSRITARLGHIEAEGGLPPLEVVVKHLPAIPALSTRTRLDSLAEIGTLFARVADSVARHRVAPRGAWLALYHHGEYREDSIDIEVAVPVAAGHHPPLEVAGAPPLSLRELPACTVAAAAYPLAGAQDARAANRAIGRWIAAYGYRIAAAPCRDAYPDAPQAGTSLMVETQWPIMPPAGE